MSTNEICQQCENLAAFGFQNKCVAHDNSIANTFDLAGKMREIDEQGAAILVSDRLDKDVDILPKYPAAKIPEPAYPIA